MRKGEFIFNTLTLPVDFLMLLTAGIVTYILRTRIVSSFRPVMFQLDLPFDRYLGLVVIVALGFIAAYAVTGLYSLRYRRGLLEEFFKIIIGSMAGVMGLIVVIFLRQELFNSRFLVLGAWFFAIIFVSIGRLIMRRLQEYFVTRHDFGIHKVMVIGTDDVSQKIIQEINGQPQTGYRLVKHLSHPELTEIVTAVAHPGIDEVLLANPDYPPHAIREIVDFCHENHIIFKFVPNIYQTLTTNFSLDTLTGIPLIELRRTALTGWGKIAKRIVDIIAASFFLLILSPLFAIMALAIKLDSRGPVFVGLERISKNRSFRLFKFRSMIDNAESLKAQLQDFNERKDSPLFKIKNDPRVTRLGRYLRKYRIDEFPQFLNVLKGDIALVGPRPHQPDEIARYQKHHKRVLAIQAGATGLAQISGSSDLPFEEEVALDTHYIENWSLWWDLKIIFQTAFKIFTDKSAA